MKNQKTTGNTQQGKAYPKPELCWEKSPQESLDEALKEVNKGNDSLILKSFVHRLSWASNEIDHGFSAFMHLLKNGLPVFDKNGNVVDLERLSESCTVAERKDNDAAFLEFDKNVSLYGDHPHASAFRLKTRHIENNAFFQEQELEGEDNLCAFFDEDKDWTDFLAEEERTYVIYRNSVAQICYELKGESFPWVSLTGEHVSLPVADFYQPPSEDGTKPSWCIPPSSRGY